MRPIGITLFSFALPFLAACATQGVERGAASLTPTTSAQLAELQRSLLFGEADVTALRQSRTILADQTDAVLDVWYGFVGSHPHLLHTFTKRSDGKPDAGYLARVRTRFAAWILTTAEANFDDVWLAQQHEIGLRHHRAKKNRTDSVESVDHVPLRHVIALVYPVTATLRPFLAKKGASAEDVDRMHAAWTKAVLLQVILWAKAYVPERDW